ALHCSSHERSQTTQHSSSRRAATQDGRENSPTPRSTSQANNVLLAFRSTCDARKVSAHFDAFSTDLHPVRARDRRGRTAWLPRRGGANFDRAWVFATTPRWSRTSP